MYVAHENGCSASYVSPCFHSWQNFWTQTVLKKDTMRTKSASRLRHDVASMRDEMTWYFFVWESIWLLNNTTPETGLGTSLSSSLNWVMGELVCTFLEMKSFRKIRIHFFLMTPKGFFTIPETCQLWNMFSIPNCEFQYFFENCKMLRTWICIHLRTEHFLSISCFFYPSNAPIQSNCCGGSKAWHCKSWCYPVEALIRGV